MRALLLSAVLSTAEVAAEPVREMSTDRPDVTESPRSVAAGLFQVEMSFLDYERERSGPDRRHDWVAGSLNLKYGLARHSDLQLVVNLHSRRRRSGPGGTDRASGFDDVTVRFKRNLWGNDGGRTALALMPFVTIPTHGEIGGESWSGGLVIPWSVKLADRVSLGLMAQCELAPDPATDGTDVEWLATAGASVELTERWGVYAELIAETGEAIDEPFRAATGLTFGLTDNLVLDGGVRVGLNRVAPDFAGFAGMSVRF